MPTKPTVKPRWATTDVVDPTSGQNNVVEPSTSKKDTGWDRHEKPERQFFNWQARFTYEWIDWFDGTTIPLTLTGATTNEQKSDGTGHTHSITKTTTAQAQTGTDDVGMMTALKTKEAVDSYGFLAANNLQEIEDAGAAAQLAARGNIGVREYTEASPIVLNGDFTGGSIVCARIGNIVTITTVGNITHASLSSVSTADGLVPSGFRPSEFIRNTSQNSSIVVTEITISDLGRLDLQYHDSDTGASSARTTPGADGLSISFVVSGDVT